jgi:DNA-binding PadR family transcriptional regulator
MAKRRKVGNLMALALLALLTPGQPMHPYEMANLLRRTGKERDMKIKWGSLYTVVQNLEKHGFIEATSSGRDGRRPERTLYAITDAGRAELKDWLRELVAVPEPEIPRFEAALSVLGVLSPDELIPLLELRVKALADGIAADRASLSATAEQIPRVFLIEGEFAIALREAELAWVRGLLQEIADGTLTGVEQWRQFHATGQMPDEIREMLMGGGPTPS